jgi:hypothetical protein
MTIAARTVLLGRSRRGQSGPVWDGADDELWAGAGPGPTRLVGPVRAKGPSPSWPRHRVVSRPGRRPARPDALTIGFARRFATYKRATCCCRSRAARRLLLLDGDRPVQFVFAGKAHPADDAGKEMIREIVLFARQLGRPATASCSSTTTTSPWPAPCTRAPTCG